MRFLVDHFIQYLKYLNIRYECINTENGYLIRLFNLPVKLDRDLINATYGSDENPKKVCTPYDTKVNRWLEVSINQSNFGGKLNAITAIMERHVRNRAPDLHSY